jgi:hypothetical protein
MARSSNSLIHRLSPHHPDSLAHWNSLWSPKGDGSFIDPSNRDRVPAFASAKLDRQVFDGKTGQNHPGERVISVTVFDGADT